MTDSQPDPDLAGEGLHATGKTADQFSPGDDAPGATYGSPSGTGGAEKESSSAEADENAAQDAEGGVEGS